MKSKPAIAMKSTSKMTLKEIAVQCLYRLSNIQELLARDDERKVTKINNAIDTIELIIKPGMVAIAQSMQDNGILDKIFDELRPSTKKPTIKPAMVRHLKPVSKKKVTTNEKSNPKTKKPSA